MYQYTPLQNLNQDIRLVELLSESHEDVIRIKIQNVSLVDTDENLGGDSRVSLEELQATLPPDWNVFRNLQGRIIFTNKEDDSVSSWKHPNPQIDMSSYEMAPQENTFEPKYEAISYVWGSDQRSRFVEVLSHSASLNAGAQNKSGEPETSVRLPVTENLWVAFQYLRRSDESRIVWTDAICINQDDDTEKGFQVQRMADIYRLAYRVVVWLGPEADNSKLALSTFDYLAVQVKYEEHNRFIFCAPDAKERNWFRGAFQLPYDHETLAATNALVDRPWFQRLWVAQEIHLANKCSGPLLQCGTDIITFSSFQKAMICLHHKARTQGTTFRHLAEAYNQVCPKADSAFRTLVSQVSYNKLCREPRDKVYGVLGLAPRRFTSKIKPNYKKTFPTSDVYKSAFLTHVRIVQRLELFEHCLVLEEKAENWPSWVPNWAVKHSMRNESRPQFATSTSRVHFIHELEKPNVLKLLGARCATVNLVTRPIPEASDHPNALQHVSQWRPLELDFASYKPTGETLKQAYALNLIFGDVSERRMHYGEEKSLLRWVEQSSTDGLFGRLSGVVEESSTIAISKIRLRVAESLNNCYGRVFFQTAEGYIGLAPTGTRIGDIVVILLGCSNPLVLRPIEDSSYQLIGESYSHGLGDAVRLLGHLPRPWKVMADIGPGLRGIFRFFNTDTGETTAEDPRLEPSAKWERIKKELDADDPEHYDFFKHKETGEVINYDPRLEPEALEAKGVQLTWLSLV